MPNVYQNLAASSIAGTLTLDAQNNPNAVFIFKVGGAFTSAANSTIVLINGANADNIFWVAEGAVAFAANTVIKGTFISHSGAISLGLNTNLRGRALTLAGAIGINASTINTNPPNPADFTMGTAANFILFTTAGAITNAGTSSFNGAIGTNFGAVTGFPVGTSSIYVEDPTTATAAADLAIAYASLVSRTPTNTVHAPAFGNGETLTAGVYAISGASSVGGDLILNGEGNPSALFIFQVGGAFTTGAGTQISLINGANAGNVYWVAEGAVALAANLVAEGTFIAHAGAISIGANTVLTGRALSMAGAITLLDGMVITLPVLSIENHNATEPIVYQQDQNFVISLGNRNISSVVVYDLLGQQIETQININSNETKIAKRYSSQVVILKITDEKNQVFTQKILD